MSLHDDVKHYRIYCDGELEFDGSDPSTYTIIETAEDLAKLQAEMIASATTDPETTS